MSRRTQKEILQEKLDVEILKNKLLKTSRANTILNKWDATEANSFRRQPVVERAAEGGIYDQSKRMKGCNIGRDLERNYSPAKSIIHQFRVNVVGSLGKIRVNSDGGDDITRWFNQVWSKDCDFREDCSWSTQLQNILAAEIREGDTLVVFDDGVIEDSGKLLTWEADQICAVTDDVLKAKGYAESICDNGIIRDKWGRILAYAVTGERGSTQVDDPAKVTIFKREDARLCKNPWRPNQGRGTPSMLTSAGNFTDLYEILSSYLQTTKRASKQYAFVKRENAVTDFDDPTSGMEYLPENDGRSAADVAGDGANQATHTARNYESLEAFTGGLMDYLQPEDSVEIPKLDHPTSQLAPFIEAVLGFGGASMGMARAYTLLRADSSYTSFRGDMIMTWVTFRWWQKHLERSVCDWVATKAIRWAMRKGFVPVLENGWENSISWTWPQMPEVDQLDYENAVAQALKNGTTDYAELLGPDWQDRLSSLADQVDFIRENKIPLAILEAKSGGVLQDKDAEDNKTEEEQTR